MLQLFATVYFVSHTFFRYNFAALKNKKLFYYM